MKHIAGTNSLLNRFHSPGMGLTGRRSLPSNGLSVREARRQGVFRKMAVRPTRRKFLQGSAAVVGSGMLGYSADLAHVTSSREVLREFPFGDVVITGGPLKQQYDRIHASYLALDNDRLLKVYRQRAGMAAPGPDMGGWYDADGFVPGHSLGQYVSGLARIGAATGDPACQRKVRELVLGFGATLGASADQSVDLLYAR
jgi:hypothetical protein